MKTYKKNITGLRIVKDSTAPTYEAAKITSSNDAVAYMRRFWDTDIEIYESFFLLLLNRANNTVAYVKISQGGVCGTVVDSKIIAKYVSDTLSSGAIIAHNHPSGNTKPSQQDINLTKRVKEVLALLDCSLLDSLIITSGDFYSMADNGDLF